MRVGFSLTRQIWSLPALLLLFMGCYFLGARALAQEAEDPPINTALRSVRIPEPNGPEAVGAVAPAIRAAVSTLTINPNFDDAAMSAAGLSPGQIANVHAGFAAAAAQLTSNYSDPINVNVTVTAVAGTGTLGLSGSQLRNFSYAAIRSAHVGDAKTADDFISIGGGGSISSSDPIGSSHRWWVTRAQAKALGLIPDDLSRDGTFTFGAGYTYSFNPDSVGPGQHDFQGVAMHEITEIMGRNSGLGTTDFDVTPAYLASDLFRFIAPGVRGLTDGGGIQFSLDNGTTLLKLFNNAAFRGGDPGDWASGTNDSFNAFGTAGVKNGLSAVDFRVMDVIGYDRTSGIIPQCSYTIGPGSGATVPAAGGSGTINIVTTPGCAWSAATFDSWLTITSGASGSGSGTVQFLAAPNPLQAQRVANISVASQTYRVTQVAGPGCVYALGPGSGAQVPAAGSSGSISVTTPVGCPWSAISDSNWLTIIGGITGSGPGSVQFLAAANIGPQRSGVITVNGQTYTVIQTAGTCTYALGPGSGTSIGSDGGTGSITVTTVTGCDWVASSNSGWLIITGGFAGLGQGVVQYSVQANTGTSRSGIITIAGQSYTVTQASGSAVGTADNALSLSQFAGGGTEWNTTLFITNLSNTTESFTLRFYDDLGLPQLMPIDTLGMVNTITGTLNPGQVRRYQTGANPTLQVAWALLTPATPSTARLSGFAVMRQTVAGGTSTVSSEAVVDFTAVTESRYVLLYDNLAGPVTTAAFANPDPVTSLTILADIRDEDGTILATDSITLPPLGHTAFRLMDRFAATVGRRGSIRFNSSPRGFTGLGLRFSQFGTFTSFSFLTSRDIQ